MRRNETKLCQADRITLRINLLFMFLSLVARNERRRRARGSDVVGVGLSVGVCAFLTETKETRYLRNAKLLFRWKELYLLFNRKMRRWRKRSLSAQA